MIWLPLYLSLFSGPAVDPELEKAVQTYWDLLQKGDKAGALRYVIPEGQNLFLNRRTNPFRSWELDKIEPRSRDEALVTVKAEQMLFPAGVYYPVPLREVWVRQQDGWRVRIRAPNPEQLKRALAGGTAPRPRGPKPGALQVLPKQVKIHFLDRSQRGARSGSGTASPKPSTFPVSTTTRPVSSCWRAPTPSPRARTSAWSSVTSGTNPRNP